MTEGFLARLGPIALLLAILLPASRAIADDTGAAAIIADQIRRQGYPCKTPISATRDKAQSKPNAVIWHLTCSDGTYRVVLVPDLAARVERVER